MRGDIVRKNKYKHISILLMIMVMIVFGLVFSSRKDSTNKESPKRATLVKMTIMEDMIYE